MSSTRMRPARLALAVALVLPAVVLAAGQTSVAAPTRAEVEAAAARAEEIGHDLEVAIEAYNELRVRLQGVQDKLADALHDKRTAEALAAEAMGQLEDRAVAAYTGAGSQMDVLLGASDLSEFSDRLEFMGALAQNDADLANTAQNAQQQAEWASARYTETIEEKQRELDSMAGTRAEIERMLAEQRALVDQLDREYREYVQRQEAQAAAAAAAEQAAAADSSGTGGEDTSGGGGGAFVPPPNATAAQIAIAAARSKIGSVYVWGTAGPDTFDCSGLTSWAYAQAGVSLPHSSASQATYPEVPYSSAQPGDLLFFYSPVSHVALYTGGGMMIHARHPGPGGEVQEQPVASYGTPVVKVSRPT